MLYIFILHFIESLLVSGELPILDIPSRSSDLGINPTQLETYREENKLVRDLRKIQDMPSKRKRSGSTQVRLSLSSDI